MEAYARVDVLGNKVNPGAIMKVEYCGGWGQTKYYLRLKNEVNGHVPDKYQFHFFKDPS